MKVLFEAPPGSFPNKTEADRVVVKIKSLKTCVWNSLLGVELHVAFFYCFIGQERGSSPFLQTSTLPLSTAIINLVH